MLSGKGSIWALGYVFKLSATPVNKEISLFNLTHSDLSAEQRVQAFRVTASPMARKLAGLLASAPVISLPIVRLIQEAMLKDSQQVHVAEVFLGGLLKPLSEINADTYPDYVQYEFMDEVRELLIDSVPSQYVLNVVDEVSKYVSKKAGLSLESFAAVLRNPQQVINADIAEKAKYFATVTAQVLRRLGGKYARVADNLDDYNKYARVADNLDDYNHDLEAILDEFRTIRTILGELERISKHSQELEEFGELKRTIPDFKILVNSLLSNPQQAINADITEKAKYFATVTTQVLRDFDRDYRYRHLGGDYARVTDKLDDYNHKDYEQINDLTSVLYDLKEILERLEKDL
ncbi:MAG: hypothetical protein KME32_00570 [Mojavia pulchra JT2-VF2]|jgi:hypothetical protein|uniref:Uncharacterized protein n=1 Tax=Mojavia pulchra JT2-VF2 TaxID=287848 RepID=A0A951PTG7_9NOST|nr:hypothetical protein [Mojavia pulchra JT2-VF2]